MGAATRSPWAGPVLVASAALWFVGSYAPTTLMPASVLGFAFERYYDVVLAFLVLTFPRVRPRGVFAVVLVLLASAYVVRTAFRLFVGCSCAGENPFALVTDDRLFERSQLVTSWVIVGAALAVLVLAGHRLRTSTPAAHRYLAPVVVSGSIAALVTAYDAFELAWFIQTDGPVVDLGEPGNEILAWSIIAAIGLVPLGFLIGALQRRGGQEAIARMAVDLDQGADPNHLRAALRHSLGDPTLELYLSDGDRGWLTSAGSVADIPAHPGSVSTAGEGDDRRLRCRRPTTRSCARTPVWSLPPWRSSGWPSRTSVWARWSVTSSTRSAPSRARLIEAAEDGRRRIVRDLHDGAQQRLIAVALSMQQAREAAHSVDPDAPFAHRVDDAITELLAAIDELRRLARGIHPAILTEEGLAPAVAGLARRSPVPVQVDIQVSERLPSVVEATAYFIVAEALTNVTRHADARSAAVRIARSNGHLDVEVRDDGTGGADQSRGSGLLGMADRLDALSGSLVVESPAGGGTRLQAVIPCA